MDGVKGGTPGGPKPGPKKASGPIKSAGSNHFAGDLDRNEVEIDLDKFLNLLQENQDLKTKLRDAENEYHRNPWMRWEHMASTVNAWRMIPRALMVFYMWLLYWAVMWFTDPNNFPPEGPSDNQTTLITVLVGAGGAWFTAYCATGGNKNNGKSG